MRRRAFIFGALALWAALPAAARPAAPLHQTSGAHFSPIFVDGGSDELTLADFRGRGVLINVWATWCVPCREEMPILDPLPVRLGAEDFHVLRLSIDHADLPAVRRFYDEIGNRHLGLYLADDLQVIHAFAVPSLPALLIDEERREIAWLVGPAERESRAALALLETTIARNE